MTVYYSKSTNAFYDSELNSIIPSDSVAITKERHYELISAVNNGELLEIGEDGQPISVPAPKPSLDTYKNTARETIDELRKSKEEQGLSYTFPDATTDVIQLRDTRDLLNIQSLVTTASLLKASGSEEPLPFQGESNSTHMLLPDEMIEMGLAVSTYIQSLYSTAWPIKEAIDAAEDHDAVDAAAVWPE